MVRAKDMEAVKQAPTAALQYTASATTPAIQSSDAQSPVTKSSLHPQNTVLYALP